MKYVSTKMHGMIDYAWIAAVPMLPRWLGWESGTKRLLTGAGLATLVYSLLTRYELGAVQLIPMRAHLAFDIVQGLTLTTAPLWLNEKVKAKALIVGLGMVAILAALTTERAAPQESRTALQTPARRTGSQGTA